MLRIKLYPSLINSHSTVFQYSFHFCNCLLCCSMTSGTIMVAFDVKECYLWCGTRIHLIILRITGYNNPGSSCHFLAQVLPENERTKIVWCKFQLSTYWLKDKHTQLPTQKCTYTYFWKLSISQNLSWKVTHPSTDSKLDIYRYRYIRSCIEWLIDHICVYIYTYIYQSISLSVLHTAIRN